LSTTTVVCGHNMLQAASNLQPNKLICTLRSKLQKPAQQWSIALLQGMSAPAHASVAAAAAA
jgi:hypothetical protein